MITVVLEERGGGAEDFEAQVNPLHGVGDIEMAPVGRVRQAAAEEEEEKEPRGSIVIGGHEWATAAPKRRSSFSVARLDGAILAVENAASPGLGGGPQRRGSLPVVLRGRAGASGPLVTRVPMRGAVV